jgi:hypothetical protein
MISFIAGLFICAFCGMVLMSCLAMAGRDGE